MSVSPTSRIFAAIAAISFLAAAHARAGAVWTSGSYDPSSWTASPANVLLNATALDNSIGYYYEGGKNMVNNPATLVDGVVPGAQCDYTKIAGISNGSVIYQLADTAGEITSISFFSRWGDGGRDGIAIKEISARPSGGEWTTVVSDDLGNRISIGMGNNSSGPALYATVANEDSSALFTNVDELKIVFASSQDNNGTGYCEIEAIGGSADLPKFTIGVADADIAAWAATVSGTITSLAGGTTGDLYFDFGTDASALVPVKVKEDLAEEESFALSLTNLNDSTTYHFQATLISDNGKESSIHIGSFTTAYAQPTVLEATQGYVSSTNGTVHVTLKNLGEQGASASLYFACGTDSAALVPALDRALSLNQMEVVNVTGLEPETTYHWSAYALNDLNHHGEPVTGSFTTYAENDIPKWIGAISSDWSEPGNWDPATAIVDGGSYNKITLGWQPGAHMPSNLDLTGITIRSLDFGPNALNNFTVGGKKFTMHELTSDSAARCTATIENDVDFDGYLRNSLDNSNMTVNFMGVLGEINDDTARAIISERYGNIRVFNPSNTLTGVSLAHVGGIGFVDDGALGIPPTDPTPQYLCSNWGQISLLSSPGRDLKVVRLHENRGLAGEMNLGAGTELRYNGEIGRSGKNADYIFLSSGDGTYRHIRLGGTMTTDGGTTEAKLNALVFADSATAFGNEARWLNVYRSAVWDFNGHDSPVSMTHYSEDNNVPSYINNVVETPITLSGTARMNLNGNTAFFGGLGDIVHTGNMDYSRTDYTNFRKIGPGTLTLAGDTYDWPGSAYFSGGTVVFDYSAHNTPRTFTGRPHADDTHLIFRGNEIEATTVALETIQNDNTVIVETQPGAAGMTFALGTVSGLTHGRAVDFRFGTGTTVVVTDLSNDATFGGIFPNFTWDHGRSWAYVTPDGSLGPLPDALLDPTLSEDTIWDVPDGSTTISSASRANAIRIGGTSTGTTLTLNGQLTIREMVGNEGSAAILITPDVGGPVVIGGSANLVPSGGNKYITVHNNCTNYPTRISARLHYTNNNGLMLVGPGTTILDNDSNGFFNGPYIFGGGTLQFTSITNNGARDWNACVSSLGNAFYDSPIGIGNNCTLEYIGTTTEGHVTDRQLKLYGSSTLKASGLGPLHFTGATAANGAYASTRLILDGEGVGIIDGAINPGACGWVEKRGNGTWTLNGTTSSYEYPTKALAGTLVVNGALPSSLEIARNATVVCGEGAVIKRHLENEGTLRYAYDSTAAEHAPIHVWGEATLGGTLEISSRPADSETTLLVADNGITGEFDSVPANCRVIYKATTATLAKLDSTVILVK